MTLDLPPERSGRFRREPRAKRGRRKRARHIVRILDGDEIGWSPLDGVPPPEYVPPVWDGPQVGKRLTEAFRTLRFLPMPTMMGSGSTWPHYMHEYWERAQYEDDPIWKAEQAEEANRIKLRPSSLDIARMEIAIAWPARYLAQCPQLMRVVGEVAYAKARNMDNRDIAKRLDMRGRLLRRWNTEGLDLIAQGLRRDDVEVF